jgi:hypothetical protein
MKGYRAIAMHSHFPTKLRTDLPELANESQAPVFRPGEKVSE